ncbi:hypothetical protein [Planctellipticum variicoloris]|uniref:hypothetical protein n=1 Tax=Planctellipticum variicoloris TaxID=3064265 RepID=UPI003013681F|nr:hypothetical protein SH412_003758 [Planctomycetaceae bacterium SH412]
MDPQVAWDEMLEAILQRDWELAVERAEALLEWMRNGGFPPETAKITMRKRWNRSMAEFGCLIALQFARQVQRRRNQKRRND